MVLAAVALDPRGASRLTRVGVADSKRFAGPEAHALRTSFVPHILDAAAHFELVVVDVREVDRHCFAGGLNRLEQAVARGLIARAPRCRRVVCDGKRLFAPLCADHPELESHDDGEQVHVAVAAASILAKVRRDELWNTIATRYVPEFGAELLGGGGGYVNPRTKRFLRAYIERYAIPPPEGRLSWPWTFAADLLGPRFTPTTQLDLNI
jgi:ribonuclease HII